MHADHLEHTIKPILTISHVTCEHPGYLCDFLDERSIAYRKIHLEKRSPCIQNKEQILQDLQRRLIGQRRVADILFGWWLGKVKETGAVIR